MMNKRKRNMIAFILFVAGIFSNISCNNHYESTKKSRSSATKMSNSILFKNKVVTVKRDSLQISVNGHLVTVYKSYVKDYDSVYNGIYRFKNDLVQKKFSIQINNIVYFTTQENVGMGYRGHLFAFDEKKSQFITDVLAKRDYIFSSGGIFFLSKNYIYSVCKPNHNKPDAPFTTCVEIYEIKEGKFHYIDYIISNGDMISDDTAIAKLYYKAIEHERIRPSSVSKK